MDFVSKEIVHFYLQVIFHATFFILSNINTLAEHLSLVAFYVATGLFFSLSTCVALEGLYK